MKIDTEIMQNQRGKLTYEQPSLKKYGTMKNLTHASAGSGGSGISLGDRIGNLDGDIIKF
jgi:hypothetical protein